MGRQILLRVRRLFLAYLSRDPMVGTSTPQSTTMSSHTNTLPSADSDLIAQTLDGCTQAFGELVRRHQDRLYNAVVHIVGCPAEAEDVLQDAFMLAFTKLATFRGQSSFFTWIYRLTVNCALSNRRRKRPLRDSDLPPDYCVRDVLDGGERPMDRLLRDEALEHVADALDHMDDLYRAILVLREIEQLDYAAIADILDIQLGTVRSRLHRARLQLRRLLESGGERRVESTPSAPGTETCGWKGDPWTGKGEEPSAPSRTPKPPRTAL